MAKDKSKAKASGGVRWYAFWVLGPSLVTIEQAKILGYDTIVMDMEHGVFTHEGADRVIAFAKSLGLEVWARVSAAERIPIQHVLDSGADGVILPHIDGLEHARVATAFAKYPPQGSRSVGGGRSWKWGGPWDGWVKDENRRVKCFPMIETAEALAEVDGILKLKTVDGLFIGPFDLGMARGRGGYTGSKEDLADIVAIAGAANKAGKPWGMNIYGRAQSEFTAKHGVGLACIGDDVTALQMGAGQMLADMKTAAKG